MRDNAVKIRLHRCNMLFGEQITQWILYYSVRILQSRPARRKDLTKK